LETADAIIGELRAKLERASPEQVSKSPEPPEPPEPRSPAEPTGTTSPSLSPPPMQQQQPMQAQPMQAQPMQAQPMQAQPTGVQIELAIMTAKASLQQLCDWTHHLGNLSYAMPQQAHYANNANSVHVPWTNEEVVQQMQPAPFAKGGRGFSGARGGRSFGKGRG
jgi:hypothetical protein